MLHKDYLELMAQWQQGDIAKIFVDGHMLELTRHPLRGNVGISTRISSSQRVCPPFISDLLSTRGQFTWNHENLRLQKCPVLDDLLLVQEIAPVYQFIYLRSVVDDFVKESEMWKGMLSTFHAKASLLYS